MGVCPSQYGRATEDGANSANAPRSPSKATRYKARHRPVVPQGGGYPSDLTHSRIRPRRAVSCRARASLAVCHPELDVAAPRFAKVAVCASGGDDQVVCTKSRIARIAGKSRSRREEGSMASDRSGSRPAKPRKTGFSTRGSSVAPLGRRERPDRAWLRQSGNHWAHPNLLANGSITVDLAGAAPGAAGFRTEGTSSRRSR